MEDTNHIPSNVYIIRGRTERIGNMDILKLLKRKPEVIHIREQDQYTGKWSDTWAELIVLGGTFKEG